MREIASVHGSGLLTTRTRPDATASQIEAGSRSASTIE